MHSGVIVGAIICYRPSTSILSDSNVNWAACVPSIR